MGLLNQRPPEHTTESLERRGRLETKVSYIPAILGMMPHPWDGHNLCFRSEMSELETDVWEREGVGLDLSPDQLQRASRRGVRNTPHRQLEFNIECELNP